jgi:transketolase
MRTAFINELMKLAEQDERIMLVAGDLGFSVLEGFIQRFPKRFINVGIAEQNMMGVASGLAMSGKIVFTYSIANFATLRCLEQIRDDACYHHANVKIVSVGAGFAYGTQGYTHFGVEDIAIMRSLPNMHVFSPADPVETQLIVQQAVAVEGPCYLRLGKAKEKVIHTDTSQFAHWKLPSMALVANGNSQQAVLTTGSITAAVQDYLRAAGLHYAVWSVPHIKPIDLDALLRIAHHSNRIYTVEEHQLSGGFGSAVLEAYERLVHQNRLQQMPLVKRIAIEDLIPKHIGSQEHMREFIDFSLLSDKAIAVA